VGPVRQPRGFDIAAQCPDRVSPIAIAQRDTAASGDAANTFIPHANARTPHHKEFP
jgi:hypothetical protein